MTRSKTCPCSQRSKALLLDCLNCTKTYCILCARLTEHELKNIKQKKSNWNCNPCTLQLLEKRIEEKYNNKLLEIETNMYSKIANNISNQLNNQLNEINDEINLKLKTEFKAMAQIVHNKFKSYSDKITDILTKLGEEAITTESRISELESKLLGQISQVQNLELQHQGLGPPLRLEAYIETQAKTLESTNLTFVKGDLLMCPSDYSIAHCVAKDMYMGAGVALQIKNKFKSVNILKNQKKGLGEVAILNADDRKIFYLVTKHKSSDKPELLDLEKSLLELRKLCDANNIMNLAIPKIGSYRDNLKWEEVLKLLKIIFTGSLTTLHVYEQPAKTLIIGDEFLSNITWNKEEDKRDVDIIPLPAVTIEEMMQKLNYHDQDNVREIIVCLGISPFEEGIDLNLVTTNMIREVRNKFKNAIITITGALFNKNYNADWKILNNTLLEVSKKENVYFKDPWAWFKEEDYWTLEENCIRQDKKRDVEEWLVKIVKPISFWKK
jgi:Macro domain